MSALPVGEWQLRSNDRLQARVRNDLAVGGTCNFSDQPYPDGTLEPAVYDALREGYDSFRSGAICSGEQSSPGCSFTGKRTFSTLRPLGNGRDAGRTLGTRWSLNVASRTDRIAGHIYCLLKQVYTGLIYDEPTLRRELSQQSAVVIPEQCLLEDANKLQRWTSTYAKAVDCL